MKQFDQLSATELFCPKCRMARPVRERLLLVLPHAELHEYRCTTCASSLGTREVRNAPVARPVPRPAARPAAASPAQSQPAAPRRRTLLRP